MKIAKLLVLINFSPQLVEGLYPQLHTSRRIPKLTALPKITSTFYLPIEKVPAHPKVTVHARS